MPGISAQLPVLLASYVPFLLVPLAMAVDFTMRCTSVLRTLDRAEGVKKAK